MKKPLSQPLFLRFLHVLRPLGCLPPVSQASVAGTQKTHLLSLQATLLPSPVEAEAETSAPPLRTPRLTPPGSHGVPFFFPALKDTSKRSINSDWKIELPGEYQIAGTTVRYVRRGLWEKISAKGPTKMPLHLMVTCCAFVFVLSLILQGVCWLSSSLGPGERFPGTWLLVGYLATCCSSLPRPLSLHLLLSHPFCHMPENFPLPKLRPGSSLAERVTIFFKRNRLQEGNTSPCGSQGELASSSRQPRSESVFLYQMAQIRPTVCISTLETTFWK